jgi:hypothetical protein
VRYNQQVVRTLSERDQKKAGFLPDRLFFSRASSARDIIGCRLVSSNWANGATLVWKRASSSSVTSKAHDRRERPRGHYFTLRIVSLAGRLWLCGRRLRLRPVLSPVSWKRMGVLIMASRSLASAQDSLIGPRRLWCPARCARS